MDSPTGCSSGVCHAPHQCAEDMQLLFLLSSSEVEAVVVLNWCLATIMDWVRANKPKLSPDKTKMLLAGNSSGQVRGVQPVLDRVALPLKEQAHNLGLLLDTSIT